MDGRLSRTFRLTLAAIVLVALVAVAPAVGALPTTYYVDPVGGDNGAAGTSEDTAFKTLHYATNQAFSGDTIVALPGTYSPGDNGEILPLLLPSGVKLKSAYGRYATTIDCEFSSSAITITDPTAGTEVTGFSIENGTHATDAGGINIVASSASTPGWPLIALNSFVANTGSNGGALNLDGSSSFTLQPRIIENDFLNNGYGSTDFGGGIHVDEWVDADIESNYFYMNSADTGGAIWSDQDSELTLENNTFQMNEAASGAGGAMYATGTTVTVDGCSYQDNTATSNGGAMYVIGGHVYVYNSEFARNHSDNNGGAIRLNLVPDADIYNNLIYENNAGDEGVIYVDDSAVSLDYNTIYGNTATSFAGVHNTGTKPVVRGCILWGHSGEDLYNTSVSYSCTEDTDLGAGSNTVGTGIIHTDPKFYDPSEADYRLQTDSPCIDVGVAGPATDYVGTSRPQDGNDDTTALFDLGAWERPELDVPRIAGADRYTTAAEAAAKAFPDGSEYAIVASGQNFPDALSAAGLCGVYRAPLLLSRTAALPAATAKALSDLGVSKVTIVGGTGAVSSAVETALKASYEVTRVAGSDRYATAAKVAEQVMAMHGVGSNKWAFVARGDQFPDALAVSPYAFDEGTPILLTRPTSLPAVTKAALEDLDIEDSIIPGGTGAVSDGVKSDIDTVLVANGGKASLRLFGADRYSTAANIAAHARAKSWGDPAYVGVATGANFPDALAGGVATGIYDGAVLLTRTNVLPASTAAELGARGPKTVWCEVYGGTGAVSDAVISDIWSALGW